MLNATVLIRMLLYKIYKIHFQYILYKYNNLGTLADNHIIKFIKEKNIGISTLNAIAEYLHLSKFSVNSNIDNETYILLENTLNDTHFTEWLKYKWNFEKARFDNAKEILDSFKKGIYSPNNTILNQRIINALEYLIGLGYYSSEKTSLLEKIISSNDSLSNKLLRIQNSKILDKKLASSSNSILKLKNLEVESDHDPYENFRWGGLTGEEAYDGYWNTE
jgi:hypothetical protein